MTRPRGYDLDAVVEAARGAFWERGYQDTGIADLERLARVNRSSLYNAFGSKEGLFRDSLNAYIREFINPLLTPMEAPGAGMRDVEGFFTRLAALFRDATSPARHGCLWVNTIAEFAGRPAPVDARAAELRDRLRAAFCNALGGTGSRRTRGSAVVRRRAQILGLATWGVWIGARDDPADAALLCDALVAEVRSWRCSPS
ncbi:MAG TPA: helix-turn-helix domain-containing protein [Candidatus Dormibacteraeota bacterium]|jgi:AcrR family transcriptional regulator